MQKFSGNLIKLNMKKISDNAIYQESCEAPERFQDEDEIALTHTYLTSNEQESYSSVVDVGKMDGPPLTKRKKARKSGLIYKKKEKSEEDQSRNKARRLVDTKGKFDWLSRVISKFIKKVGPEFSMKFKKRLKEFGKIQRRSLPYFFICLKVLKIFQQEQKFITVLREEIQQRKKCDSQEEYYETYFLETQKILRHAAQMFLTGNQFEAICLAYQTKPTGHTAKTKCPSELNKFQGYFLEVFSNANEKSK